MGTLGAKTSEWHPLQVAPRARALLAIRHCTSIFCNSRAYFIS